MTELIDIKRRVGDMCGDHSKPSVPSSPSSYFICTLDCGHAARHSACDGQGQVLARWQSPAGKIEVFLPSGQVVVR